MRLKEYLIILIVFVGLVCFLGSHMFSNDGVHPLKFNENALQLLAYGDSLGMELDDEEKELPETEEHQEEKKIINLRRALKLRSHKERYDEDVVSIPPIVMETRKESEGRCRLRRFVVDDVLDLEECSKLMSFGKKYLKPRNNGLGIKVQASDISSISMDSDPDLPSMTLFLLARKRIHAIISKYLLPYNEKRRLCFDYTHLIERGSGEGVGDYSQQIHTDNCLWSVRNHTCVSSPHQSWRAYTAILFLNDQGATLRGGEVVFEEPECHSVYEPRCGRLLGFSSGAENPYGVKKVTAGESWALGTWLTFDCGNHSETLQFNDWFDKHPAARWDLVH